MAATIERKDPVQIVCQAPSCGYDRTVEDADSTRLSVEHETVCGDTV